MERWILIPKWLCYSVLTWVCGAIYISFGWDCAPALMACVLCREQPRAAAILGILLGALAAGRQEADAFLALYWYAAALLCGNAAARLRRGLPGAMLLALGLGSSAYLWRWATAALTGGAWTGQFLQQSAVTMAGVLLCWPICTGIARLEQPRRERRYL